MKKQKRLKFIILGLIILCLIIYICLSSGNQRTEIDFLDVGQGDSSLIKLPNNKIVLIDGGPDNLVLKRLGENLPFYRRQIDFIVLSHPHDDHLIGLLEVINRYQVGTIIYVGEENNPEILTLLLQKAKARNIRLIELKNEMKINYSSECFFDLLNPESLGIKKDDNNSIVVKLNCNRLVALFSGDNSSAVETALLKTKTDWSANILKASHHGSKTANSEAFLRAIGPRLFVISVGVDNRFGHPDSEILKRAESLKISIKRTDKMGTIKVFGK